MQEPLHPERAEQLRQVIAQYQDIICQAERVKLLVNFGGGDCSAQIEFLQLK